MNGERVLVTGASGFIAKHIVLRLVADGWSVRGTVRNEARADEVRSVIRLNGLDPDGCELVRADLASDEGWDEAASGCRYVLHTASPFPVREPRDPAELIRLAEEGTRRVLAAGAKAGVERAVVTSSVAAVLYGHDKKRTAAFGEADYTNLESRAVSSYARSKTLAEKAAWVVSGQTGLQLSTINPGLVLGPVLDGRFGTSARIVAWMMAGRLPVVPDISFAMVDVRDVALAHVRAMTVPAAGRRFLLTAPDPLSFPEMAKLLLDAYPDRRRKIRGWRLPSAVLRAAALVSPGAAMIADELGRRKTIDTLPARNILGIEFTSSRDAVLALAESLLRHRCV